VIIDSADGWKEFVEQLIMLAVPFLVAATVLFRIIVENIFAIISVRGGGRPRRRRRRRRLKTIEYVS